MDQQEQKNVVHTNQLFFRSQKHVKFGLKSYVGAHAVACDFYKEMTGKTAGASDGLTSPDGKVRIKIRRREHGQEESFDVIGYFKKKEKEVIQAKK